VLPPRTTVRRDGKGFFKYLTGPHMNPKFCLQRGGVRFVRWKRSMERYLTTTCAVMRSVCRDCFSVLMLLGD
jgi:hypothetical protein